MEFFDKIRGLREDSDLSQETIAEFLGITRPQYSLYETGKREFKIKHIQQLALYFNISADFILGLPNNLPHTHSKTKPKMGGQKKE